MNNKRYQRQVYKSGGSRGVGPATVRFLLMAMLAVFCLLYLVQTAQGSDMSMQIRNLNDQKKQLQEESSTLTVNASRLQSLQKLNESAAVQGMVAAPQSIETVTLPTE